MERNQSGLEMFTPVEVNVPQSEFERVIKAMRMMGVETNSPEKKYTAYNKAARNGIALMNALEKDRCLDPNAYIAWQAKGHASYDKERTCRLFDKAFGSMNGKKESSVLIEGFSEKSEKNFCEDMKEDNAELRRAGALLIAQIAEEASRQEGGDTRFIKLSWANNGKVIFRKGPEQVLENRKLNLKKGNLEPIKGIEKLLVDSR